MSLPNLSNFAIGEPYGKILLEAAEGELRMAERRQLKDFYRTHTTKPSMERFRARAAKKLENVKNFLREDYTWLSMPGNIIEYLKTTVLYHSENRSASDTFNRFDQIAFDLISYSDEEVQSTIEERQEYFNYCQTYVDRHADSKHVNMWTQERDEVTGNAPPHRMIDQFLLKLTKCDATNDTTIDRTAIPDLSNTIEELYSLVVNAPRTPRPLMVIRSVRHEARLPTSWYNNLANKKMLVNDSIVLPTFLSTSILDDWTNWDAYGNDEDAREFDPWPGSRDLCCMIRILIPTGIPVLPLFMWQQDHDYENEVLLPPGLRLVYIGEKFVDLEPEVETHDFVVKMDAPELPAKLAASDDEEEPFPSFPENSFLE